LSREKKRNIGNHLFFEPSRLAFRGAVHAAMGARTDEKEKQIFLIYKEIQSGAVAKSYMTNGILIYGEIFAHFLLY
jgi:hypothetical protein